MAALFKGALKAGMRIACFFADNKEPCLFQPWGTDVTPKCLSYMRTYLWKWPRSSFAASVALNELVHLGYVTSELGLRYPQPIMLEVDNATAITLSKDQVRRSKLRHMDCRQALVKALRICNERIVQLIKVDTHDNFANLNSKLLNVVRLEYLLNKTMVRQELLTQKAAAPLKP